MRLAALLLAFASLALVVVPGCSSTLGECLRSCCDDVSAGTYCGNQADNCERILERGDDPSACVHSMSESTPEAGSCFVDCE